jgi:hypothetical protein
LATHSCGRECCLGAGMAATDNNDVELAGIQHVRYQGNARGRG